MKKNTLWILLIAFSLTLFAGAAAASPAVSVKGGGYHTIALKGEGTVWTWEYNAMGQLGDGTRAERNSPVRVTFTMLHANFPGAGIWKWDGTAWSQITVNNPSNMVVHRV
jgi:hypothetical protein